MQRKRLEERAENIESGEAVIVVNVDVAELQQTDLVWVPFLSSFFSFVGFCWIHQICFRVPFFVNLCLSLASFRPEED